MPRERKPRSPKRKIPRPANVVDIKDKLLDKLTEEIVSVTSEMTERLDATIADALDIYRTWEHDNPDTALKAHHKLAMIRYGFVGPGGFARCHQPHRLPETAFFLAKGGIDERIQRDEDAAELVMCPAMQAERCQGVWRAMRIPPCQLLLLEVLQGLGGGVLDDSVDEVLSDWACARDQEETDPAPASFARAARLVRKYGLRWARMK